MYSNLESNFSQKPPLSKKEKSILDYLLAFNQENGFMPTRQEIAEHFDFKSANSAQQYIQQLMDKGYLENTGKKQGLILSFKSPTSLSYPSKIPLLGKVAAGLAVESNEISEELEVPPSLLGKGKCFALKIRGLSMIEDGILEDDVVIIEETNQAKNGDVIVALINGESTIKRYFKKGDLIELQPANSKMKPIKVKPNDNFQIRGILKSLMRKL